MSLEIGGIIEEERRSAARGLMQSKTSRALNKRNSKSSAKSQVMAFSNISSDALYIKLKPTDSREITFMA